MFVVSLERSVSEVHRTHTGVITAVTAGGHASLTMTALHLSVMQMYTRVGTVEAAIALMRPRCLTSWHCCWMHKYLLVRRAALSDESPYYSLNYFKVYCWLYTCWNAYPSWGKQEFSDYYFCMLTAVEEIMCHFESKKNVFKIKAFL